MSASFSVASVLLSRYNALQSLRSLYPDLKAHLLFYNWNAWAFNNETGLVYWDQYGDWNSLAPTEPLLPANVYYFSDSLFMADLAAQLGEPDDALAFLGLSAYLNAELPAVFASPPNKSAHVWDKGSQAAQAIPLYWGIGGDVYANLTDGSLAALVADVAAHGQHYTVGTLGSRFLLQALSMSGRGDVALALASQTTYPSIGAMVEGTADQPALGTLWEGWEGPTKSDGSSGNHIMLGGGIGEWLYSYALGLRYYSRRATPLPYDARARDCEREVGFGIDIRATHGVSADDMCVLARAMRLLRARRASGEAAGSLVEFDNLRATVAAVRTMGPYAAAEATGIVPVARLVIDAHVAKALRSAHGTISTPYGPMSASWSLNTDTEGDITQLSMNVAVPSGVTLDVFMPVDILMQLSRNGSADIRVDLSRTATAVGPLAVGIAQWSTLIQCNSITGPSCAVGDLGDIQFTSTWAPPGEADDRRVGPRSGNPLHWRLALPPGAWALTLMP